MSVEVFIQGETTIGARHRGPRPPLAH